MCMHVCIYTEARVFTVAPSSHLRTFLGDLGASGLLQGITAPCYVPVRDALGGRVITGKKNIALGSVSADFRRNGARVSRQAFLAN